MIGRINRWFQTTISKHYFLKSVLLLGGGTALGQAITIASIPIVSRLYSPDELGKFGLFLTYVNTVVLLSSLSYETSIVSANSDDDAAYLTTLSLILNLLISLIAPILLLGLMQNQILGFEKLPPSATFAVIVSLFLGASLNSLKYWLIRFQQFKLLGTVPVHQSIGRSLSQVSLGLLHFGWFGLLLSEVIGRSLGVGKAFSYARSILLQWLKPMNIDRIKEVSRKYSTFPKYVFPSVLVNVLSVNMIIPIIVYLHGESAGGQFFMAQRVLALPVGLISSSVSDVFHHQVASYLKTKPSQITGLLLRTCGSLFLTGIVPVLLIVIFGSAAFRFIVGGQWEDAGHLLVFMAPSSLVGLCVGSVSRLVYISEDGQRWKLFYDFFYLLNQGIVIYVSLVLKLSFQLTVALSSFLIVLSYFLYFIILMRLASKAKNIVSI